MKTGIVFFILASLILSCGNRGGKIEHKIKYTTAITEVKSSDIESENYYSQFGIYITSLTPSIFTSRITIMCYQDNWDLTSNSTHTISYVDGHDNDPRYEIATYADFSNNQEVNISPILYSTDLKNGIFEKKEITFNYFNFVPDYFYQEVALPEQYASISIEQFNQHYNEQYYSDSVKINNVLKIKSYPLVSPIFSNLGHSLCWFVFGNTDSTYIFNMEGDRISPSPDFPFQGNTNATVIRSNKYTPITVKMPPNGETIEMYSTISFNTENLIQVYAGHDNIPYTSDDIFVYAPNYWERLGVLLEIN
jgi:hypothetical protein